MAFIQDRSCGCRHNNQYQPSKPAKIFLECGFDPQDAIFEIDDGRVEDGQKFVLDRVLIDTTQLCRPQIKFEFSSLVVFEAEDEEGTEHEVEVNLLFKLEKVCNGVVECVRSWDYLKEFDIENDIDELEVEISEPYTVTFCDKVCPGCCEYRMVVEGVDFEGEFENLYVTKPSLSAIVQGC